MNESTIPVFLDDLDPETHAAFMASRFLAVDTETQGLQTVRDRLCLVQMCNEHGQTALVQIRSQRSAPLLQEVLSAPHVEKIFHFARFDLASLKHWLNIEVQPVFCTKIASRLVRTYTDRHGLKDLVREMIGIELDKEQQSSDWASESLSPEQVRYALSDVLHLVQLRHILEQRLMREHRLELAKHCMQFLPTRVKLDLAGWHDVDIFAHT